MDQFETLVLGFIAGVTILFGLPIGRLRRPAPGLSLFLNALAIGILTFLLWDVLAHGWEPVDTAVAALHEDSGDIGPVLKYGALFFGGLATGLLSLVYYQRWLANRGRPQRFGPGAMSAAELPARSSGIASWSSARQLALLIAVGIGLHNFGEGLAIGGSAASGEISLAVVLVIGFALHNGTEGFGIVAPLAGEDDRPSWGFLLLMGAIGGLPTFLGTAVGRQFTSESMSVVFMSVAAGSIVYVIVQLLGVARKAERQELLYTGLLLGLMAGFLTDMVVIAGGV